jgi:hypothetical protein
MTTPTVEQISPELVLVDPELAHLVRTDPRSYGPVIPQVAPPHETQAMRRPAEDRARRRTPPGWAWIPAGVLVIVAGSAVLSQFPPPGSRPFLESVASPPTAPAVAATPRTTPTPAFSPPEVTIPVASVPAGTVPATRSSPPGNSTAETQPLRLNVQRRLLHVLPSKAGRLVPPTIIDPNTGMLRNNVSVTCRATATSRKFSCSVFAPSGRRVAVLSARVLANGRMRLGP